MRVSGISYDTGFVSDGANSRPRFDPDRVRRELRVIRDDLHCTAVRVIGGDPERLELAARYAAELGMEVWFSPYPLELTTEQMLDLFADCAERAERVRRAGAEVVFVTGAEMSLMNKGFLPGDTQHDRLAVLLDREGLAGRVSGIAALLDEFLGAAVRLVRARFGGRVTYAAIPLERIDWEPFDLVGVDLYRSAEVADGFEAAVRALVARGKPVAITEFGTAAYRDAGLRGGRVLEVVEYDPDTAQPVRLTGEFARDEAGQAAYLRELLAIFESAGVDSAFVFLFALDNYPHRPGGDPHADIDLASPGIVKALEHGDGRAYPGLPWEPKVAFGALAEYNLRAARR